MTTLRFGYVDPSDISALKTPSQGHSSSKVGCPYNDSSLTKQVDQHMLDYEDKMETLQCSLHSHTVRSVDLDYEVRFYLREEYVHHHGYVRASSLSDLDEGVQAERNYPLYKEALKAWMNVSLEPVTQEYQTRRKCGHHLSQLDLCLRQVKASLNMLDELERKHPLDYALSLEHGSIHLECTVSGTEKELDKA